MTSPIDPPGPAREPGPPGHPTQLHRERVRIIAEHNRAGVTRRVAPAAGEARPETTGPAGLPPAVAAQPLAGQGTLPGAVGRSLRRRWPLLLVTALLGLALGEFAERAQDPVYQATTTVFFSLDRGQTVNEFAAGVTYTQDLVPSYAAIATQPLVLDPVITALKLPVTSAQLARQVDVSTPSGTTLIDITVTDPSPTAAAAIANQISTQLSGVVATLSPRGPENAPSLRVTATSPATESTQPVELSPVLLATAGAFGGLLFGLLVLIAVEAATRPVRHRQDLAGLTVAPVLGAVVADRQAGRHPLPLLTDDTGQRAEDFRYLRANLGLLGADGPRCVLVTSPMAGEGRTSVAVNLAVAMSRTSRRTLLIDADLRSPSVAGQLEIATPGLSAVLAGTSRLDQAIWRRCNSALSVLPAGELPPNPGELLASDQMRRLLDTAQTDYDVVIIDTPPLLSVADAASVAALTGHAVLVVRAGRTRSRRVSEAVARLDAAGAQVIGIVVNGERRPGRRHRAGSAGSPEAVVESPTEPGGDPTTPASDVATRQFPLDAAAR